MKLSFKTKEESNQAQQEEFLKLQPVERIYAFLNLMDRLKEYPTKAVPENQDNFLIEITAEEF